MTTGRLVQFGNKFVQIVDDKLMVYSHTKNFQFNCAVELKGTTKLTIPHGFGGESNKRYMMFQWEAVGFDTLDKKEDIEMVSGLLSIRKLGSIGVNVLDISTYWLAIWDGKPFSIGYRGSCWRSDDNNYYVWKNIITSKLVTEVQDE